MLLPGSIYINLHYRLLPERVGPGHPEDWHDNFYAQGKNRMTDGYNLTQRLIAT